MRRFALPLAAFVLANGALVLFNQSRISQMKSRVAELEADRIDLKREVDAQRLELQSVSNDLCATELSKLQAERELRDLRRCADPKGDVPQPPIDGKVVARSKQSGVVVLSPGRDSGCVAGMRFTIYRGDKFVATALVDDVGDRYVIAKIQLQHLEPAEGDEASNHILMSSTRPPAKEGK